MTETGHAHRFEWADPVAPSKADAYEALAVLNAYLDDEAQR